MPELKDEQLEVQEKQAKAWGILRVKKTVYRPEQGVQPVPI